MERSLAKPIYPTHQINWLAGTVDMHQPLRKVLPPPRRGLRGTHRHKISRWKQGRRYRNFIKMQRHDLPMTRLIFDINHLE